MFRRTTVRRMAMDNLRSLRSHQDSKESFGTPLPNDRPKGRSSSTGGASAVEVREAPGYNPALLNIGRTSAPSMFPPAAQV